MIYAFLFFLVSRCECTAGISRAVGKKTDATVEPSTLPVSQTEEPTTLPLFAPPALWKCVQIIRFISYKALSALYVYY